MTVITTDGRWLKNTLELRAAGYAVGEAELRRPGWPPTGCLCGVDVAAVLQRGAPATVITHDGFYELGGAQSDPLPATPHLR